ncbi:DUF1569 domain-containing protein [Terrimonas pollutisoli]|uniref:DUF1569 domain-containing protein n=1 Tax=Terrimonas pollutisoli TaxID=3034147 RepID=UPI0023EE2747|nr:DUF1569 domain-containing protein [Terrimonas sp. H1YJ31]
MNNIFLEEDTTEIINRINKLNPDSKPRWGKMTVAQMLAHCNVTYAYTYEPEKFRKPSFFMCFILKTIVKKYVLSAKPYKQNGRTGPDFIITGERNFEMEKEKLIQNITRTQQLSEKHFQGLENLSFGKMSAKEWNTMFSKHLNHHLGQFGV